MLNDRQAVLDRVKWPDEDNRVPREVYLDEDLYRLELEHVFGGPHWLLIGHASEIPNPGDYKTTLLGNVPLIIVRDLEGELHVLVNACAHRGTALLRSTHGNLAESKCFTCIYHGWRYDLTGKLTAATLPQEFPVDFSKEQYGLPAARMDTYAGAIFATLSDETPPLLEYLGEITEALDLALGDGDLVYLGSQKVIFECNWKIAAENLYDGYHTISLHQAFRLLQMKAAGGDQYLPDYEKYGHIWNEYRTNPPEELAFLKDPSVLDLRTKEEARNRIINVFPIGIVSDQVDTLALRYAIPKDVKTTEMQFAVFARRNESADVVEHRVRQGSNLFGPEGFISLEDQTALARMQDGAPARGENVVLKGTSKRFPPYRIIDEAGIRHFYGTYRRAMGF